MTNPPLPPLPDTLSHSYVAYLLQRQGFTVKQITDYLRKPDNTPFSHRQIQRYLAEGKATYKIPKRKPTLTKAQAATIASKKVDIDVNVNDQFKEMIGYIQYASDHGIKASLNELTGLFDKTKKLENEDKDFAEDNELLGKFEALLRELAPLMGLPANPQDTLYENPQEEQDRIRRFQKRREALAEEGRESLNTPPTPLERHIAQINKEAKDDDLEIDMDLVDQLLEDTRYEES